MNHNETYKQQIREAIETHGSLFSIPAEERYLIMERHRAGEVLRKYEGSVNPNVLREYGIPGTIVKEICGDADWQVVKKTKRAQKRQKVEKWCSEHAGTTVTPQTISEIAEFSYSTALSYIAERPDLFTKVKRGYYLIRDPHAERQAAN